MKILNHIRHIMLICSYMPYMVQKIYHLKIYTTKKFTRRNKKMSREYKCQSCGADISLKYRFSKTIVCGYCHQTSYLINEALTMNGDKCELSDYGSAFTVGASISVNAEVFNVAGHMRYSYADGFWDEWLIVSQKSESQYWIQDDEGDLVVYQPLLVSQLPNFENLVVGKTVEISKFEIFITEKQNAVILGSEGELPFTVISGEQADFVDGIIVSQGKPISIEYLSNETVCSIGTHILLSQIDFL